MPVITILPPNPAKNQDNWAIHMQQNTNDPGVILPAKNRQDAIDLKKFFDSRETFSLKV